MAGHGMHGGVAVSGGPLRAALLLVKEGYSANVNIVWYLHWLYEVNPLFCVTFRVSAKVAGNLPQRGVFTRPLREKPETAVRKIEKTIDCIYS